METRFDSMTRALVDAVLTAPGDTSPDLRRAIEARIAAAAGGDRDASGEIPEELETYVEKVGKHAYKVTDEDVEGLLKAGYSEDAVFEITLAAVVGAGLARWERGLAALEGGEA